jgi:hypothetical protein
LIVLPVVSILVSDVMAQVSQRYVRQVIHDFNDKGFDALDPKCGCGDQSGDAAPPATSAGVA